MDKVGADDSCDVFGFLIYRIYGVSDCLQPRCIKLPEWLPYQEKLRTCRLFFTDGRSFQLCVQDVWKILPGFLSCFTCAYTVLLTMDSISYSKTCSIAFADFQRRIMPENLMYIKEDNTFQHNSNWKRWNIPPDSRITNQHIIGWLRWTGRHRN